MGRLGWNEGSVGAALSLMGLTTLVVQPVAGDWVDKATMDRRIFLLVASLVTALSASTILILQPGNRTNDHWIMYSSKVIEGVASSFIGPCLAALTLASFGPDHFDSIMAQNIYWGHVGSVMAALLAGAAAYTFYPHIQSCFYVIGLSAILAMVFIPFLPQGDPLLGRGLSTSASSNEDPSNTKLVSTDSMKTEESESDASTEVANERTKLVQGHTVFTAPSNDSVITPTASSYATVFLDRKTCILCITGFFFHFANANVLLVLGEIMGQARDDDGDASAPSRTAIPFTAGAIVTAQVIMALATWLGDLLTAKGVGRKPLFLAGLMSLPIRCALILLWKDAGNTYLLSTQVLDGVGGGLFGLIHPYLVADITFGSGRFNVVMGLTASFFGMGATISNFLGQMVVQHFGHVASLTMSLSLSFIPILVFSFMPETHGKRGSKTPSTINEANQSITV